MLRYAIRKRVLAKETAKQPLWPLVYEVFGISVDVESSASRSLPKIDARTLRRRMKKKGIEGLWCKCYGSVCQMESGCPLTFSDKVG